MRASIAAPAALVLALSLAACGGGSDGGKKGGGGGDAADPEAGVPKCSEVWVEGATLPKDYEGCMNGGTTDVLVALDCEDGSKLTSYDDTYYAVLGGKIGKAAKQGGTADDPGYKKAFDAC